MGKTLCGIKYHIVETKMTAEHLENNKKKQFDQRFDNMICFYSSLSRKKEMFVCGDDAVVLTTRRQFDWLQSQLSALPLGKL